MEIYNSNQAEKYQKLKKLSLFAFILNAPNFICTLIAAIYANTIVVWIDTLVTLSETSHSFIVWMVAIKLCKNNADNYNFGYDRLEVFVSFLCELLISFGMVAMMLGAVWNIFNPYSPDTSIWVFCLMKVSCVIWDIVLYVKQVKNCKVNSTKLNQTEKTSYLISLINDSVMGVIAVICFVFIKYEFVQYFSPIASIILALYFLVCYFKHMRVSIFEITDHSLSKDKQKEIYNVISSQCEIVKEIISVNCRKLNNKTYIEISLIFNDEVIYSKIDEYLLNVKAKIKEIEPDSNVKLIVGKTLESN